jgi:hypothetical protein
MKNLFILLIFAVFALNVSAQTKIDLGTQTKGTISGLSGVNVAAPTSTWHVAESQSFDLVYNFNGVSTYTNNTTEAKTTFGTAFAFMFDSTQILYLGKSTKFKDISIGLGVTTTSAPTMVVEYWDGSAWATLTVTDGTASMQNSGTITYTIPGSWAQTAVNGQTYFWARIKFSTTPSTAPSAFYVRPGSNQALSVFSGLTDTVPALEVTATGKTTVNAIAVAPVQSYSVGLRTDRLGRNADFVCAGAKDQVCIQKAITACAGSPCKIQLLMGTFNLTAAIAPLQSNLEISGMGAGRTIVKISNVAASVFQDTTTGTSGAPLENVTIRNMEIDRDLDTKDANTSRKCVFITYARRLTIQNIYGHGSGGTCLGVDFLDGALITHNTIINAGTTTATTGSAGIGIGTNVYASEPVIITDNYINSPGLAGILLESQAGATQTNNMIAANNIITGSGKYGIYNRGVSNVQLHGNIIRGSGVDGIFVTDYAGGVSDNVFISNNIINTSSGFGVKISAAASGNRVENNLFAENVSGSVSWALPTPTACTSPTVTASSGKSFSINVGSACATGALALVMPAAPTGWACAAGNITNAATSVPRQTGAASTTAVTISNYDATGTAANWTSSDVIRVACESY